jgi:glycosyltransferase involved in cell wall biosynthesis
VIAGRRLIVVLPAYNAASTLESTVRRLPPEVDGVILGDDGSADETIVLARRLGLQVEAHTQNLGYGANQKTCYDAALRAGADAIVMVHPDGQHPPEQVPALAAILENHPLALGSRMLGNSALSGGMPLYKFLANRGLTAFQNALLPQRLSEYHSGFRAFRRSTLERLPYHRNDDGFLFDNQLLLQAMRAGLTIGELPCPTHYGPESSSIRPFAATRYGLGVLRATLEFRAAHPPGWLEGV